MNRWLNVTILLTTLLTDSLAAPAPQKPAEPPNRQEIDHSLLAGLRVRSIGPAGMSGRVAAIAAVESDPRVVYAGAATGGVWKSTNAGISWAPIFDDQPFAAIGAIAIDPRNPDIVWVGTGEGNTRNSASVGGGIFKSLDAGKSWKKLGLDATERIHRIVLHPTDPNIAYVAALGREWGENPERGVFKTIDGGSTWTKVLYVDERTGCGDLVIDPRNPNKLFASMWQFRRWPYFFRSGGPSSGLFVTYDAGATWKRLQQEDGLPAGEIGRIGIAISHSHPEIVYALVEAGKSALLRSTDGGKSFSTVNDKPNIAPRPFYFCDIRVDPAWPSRVYSLSYGIQVSDDSGANFSALPGAGRLHGDFHAMWIAPNDPEFMYVGDDGGIGVSEDRGATMRHVANLPLAQFYHVAVDDAQPYNIYGGLQDNGSWRGPSQTWVDDGIRSHDWLLAGGGDGFDTQPVPGVADTVYSMSQAGYLSRVDVVTGARRGIRPPEPGAGTKLRFNWNAALAIDPFEPATLYYGSQFVHRSSDRGESWVTISPDLTSNNKDWQRQEQSGGLTNDVSGAENYCTLVAIAVSPKQRGVIWTGSDDGRLFVTQDGGKQWTSVEKNVPGVPPGSWIPHIEASRDDAGTAFVVFDDHRRSNWATYVYKTTDFGRSWRSLVSPVLRGYALVIEQDPVQPNLLFLGTEFGLYGSLDGGSSWLALDKIGLPTVAVSDLVVHPREHDLVIATHGRALWLLDDIRPLRSLSAALLQKRVHLFDVAPAIAFQSRAPAGGFAPGHGEYMGDNRARGALITYSLSGDELPLPDTEQQRRRKEEERQAKLRKEFEWGPFYPNAKSPTKATAEPAKPGAVATDAAAAGSTEEKPLEVLFEIRDAAGKLLRSFKGPAVRGLNRAVWDLNRRGFKEPPRERRGFFDREPTGPQVAPGRYELTLRYKDQRAKTSITVLDDPRLPRPPESWAARERGIERVSLVGDRTVALIEQLRTLRADIDSTLARIKRDEAAKKKPDEPEPDEPPKNPLVEAGEKASKALVEREKRLWWPPETVGLAPDINIDSELSNFRYMNLGSTLPPSSAHLEQLAQLEQRIAAEEADQKSFLAQEIEPFLVLVEKAGLKPIARP